MNKTNKRTGKLWEGRYKSGLFDVERYLLTCLCYIELNLIPASMVNHPGEHKWSSYHANAQCLGNALIEQHPINLEF